MTQVSDDETINQQTEAHSFTQLTKHSLLLQGEASTLKL